MKKYKLNKHYSRFLTRCIICSGLLPIGQLLHRIWCYYIADDIKNYIIELSIHVTGFISDAIILLLSYLIIPYAILLVVRTIKQIKKEGSCELLKHIKFIFTVIFVLIALYFSVSFFLEFNFDLREHDMLSTWYYG
jgi:L-cystine uptake protein TcyP (sodium:dicarboxylate symporter family)